MTPWITVDQLRLPKIVWADPRTEGAATSTAGTSSAIARASSSVSVCWLPRPQRMPPEVLGAREDDDEVRSHGADLLAIRCWAPAPTDTIAITAATPMTMPSMVRAVRSLLTRSEASAIRTAAQAFTPTASSARVGRTVSASVGAGDRRVRTSRPSRNATIRAA